MYIFYDWMFKMSPWMKEEMRQTMIVAAPLEFAGEIALVYAIYRIWIMYS